MEVVCVARDDGHRFSKRAVPQIRILAHLGVEGDAHSGETVKHRSRVRIDPTQPNLRQVHLMHAELFDEVRAFGFEIAPADLGENITTRGIDLLGLPQRTVLRIGAEVRLQVTGLRNPCAQIEAFAPGLLQQLLLRTDDGRLVRKAGIMTVVLSGGTVAPGDRIDVELPEPPHLPLETV